MQVVAGELELNHECNSMNWSPEDFESKLQVSMRQILIHASLVSFIAAVHIITKLSFLFLIHLELFPNQRVYMIY